jgi:hypothetical protein
LFVSSSRYSASFHRPWYTRLFHSGILLPSGQPVQAHTHTHHPPVRLASPRHVAGCRIHVLYRLASQHPVAGFMGWSGRSRRPRAINTGAGRQGRVPTRAGLVAEGGAAVHAAGGLGAQQVRVVLVRQLGHHLSPVLQPLLNIAIRDGVPATRPTQ